MTDDSSIPDKKPSRLKRFKAPAGKLFWLWVGYQAVKGTLTTAFIWIPMIYMWFQHSAHG
jgi:hypothetical protein